MMHIALFLRNQDRDFDSFGLGALWVPVLETGKKIVNFTIIKGYYKI